MDSNMIAEPGLTGSDPIETYLSVLSAVNNLRGAPILGDLVNGLIEEDAEEDASDHGKSDAEKELSTWGRSLGTLLANAAHYTAFACGGSTKVSTNAQTYYDTKTLTRHYLQVLRAGEVVFSWPLDAPAPVAELLAFCTPAHFGDLLTQTTVFEPSVRTAMEIPAVAASPDGYYFEIAALSSGDKLVHRPIFGPPTRPTGYNRQYNFHSMGSAPVHEPFEDVPVPPTIVRSLKEDIIQRLTKNATAVVPYKLNVYGPGGFFKPHVDTPSLSAARMIGTAVMVLPSAFSGGALRVCAGAGHLPVSAPGKPPTRELLFDWGVDPQAELTASTLPTDTTLPWAAFYGDCVHEVLPVTAGHRITLTFGIVANEIQVQATGKRGRAASATATASEAMASAVESESVSTSILAEPHADASPLVGTAFIITRILAAVAARPAAAAAFGILLSHKYTLGAVSIAQLKGADVTLYAALHDSGLYSLTLQPVAYHYHRQGAYPESDERGSSSHTVHAFGAPELEAIRKPGGLGAKSDATTSLGASSSRGIPFVRCFSSEHFVLPGATPGSLLKHESIEAAEYTGNEARAGEDEYIYFSVALLVAPVAAVSSM